MGEIIQGTVAQAGGGADIGGFLLMMVAMFAIFYFLLIRPQRKQQQQHQNLLASLKKGDEVVLSSGFVGKVFAVEDKTVTVEIAPNTRVKVLKQAVSALASTTLGSPGGKALESKGAAEKVEKIDGEPEAAQNGEDKSAKAGKKGGKRPSA